MTAALFPTTTAKMTTAELLARLQRHYIKPGDSLPGGVFLPEIGWNGATGGRADALYVGFTSTSGRILIGHELKVSRSDWLRELEKQGKADQWADQCHAWYIVAPSTDIVPAEEIPAGWGLMVVNPRTKTRLKVVVKATVHRDRQPSWNACRSLLARTDTLRAQAIAQIRYDAMEKARAEVQAEANRRMGDRLTPEQATRLRALDRLEERLGVTVAEWAIRQDEAVDAAKLGAALDLIDKAQQRRVGLHPHVVEGLDQAVARFREAQAAIDKWEKVLGA